MLSFELFQELIHVGGGLQLRNPELRGEMSGDLFL